MRLIDADVLKKHIDKLPALPDGNFAGNHSALKALVNMQPTIKPSPNSSESPNGWIPCSERLPDYEGYDEVLTTVNGRAENVRYINAVITNAEYDDTDKQWYINGCAAKWVARNGKVMSDVDVLAWMPLPEPWKGEEE